MRFMTSNKVSDIQMKVVNDNTKKWRIVGSDLIFISNKIKKGIKSE